VAPSDVPTLIDDSGVQQEVAQGIPLDRQHASKFEEEIKHADPVASKLEEIEALLQEKREEFDRQIKRVYPDWSTLEEIEASIQAKREELRQATKAALLLPRARAVVVTSISV